MLSESVQARIMWIALVNFLVHTNLCKPIDLVRNGACNKLIKQNDMAEPCLSLSCLSVVYHLFVIHAIRFLNNVDNVGGKTGRVNRFAQLR